MNRFVTFASVGLNIVLLGAIHFVLQKPAEKSALQPAMNISNIVQAQIVKTVSQTNLISQAAPAPFDWSAIESEDFLVYADNLRGIGCPEETVRGILTAEINDLFVHRRQDLFRPIQNQFWDLMAAGGDNGLLPKEIEEKADALDEEKEMLLKKIFSSPLAEDQNIPRSGYESLLADYLSPEKVRLLRETVEKFNTLRAQIKSSGLSEAETKEKLAALDKQSAEAQKNILSPDELEEINLRTSPFAQNRQNLFGFKASEEELRAMARLSLDEKPAPTDKNSPGYEKRLADHGASERKMNEQMKALLGESRFKEYERAKDDGFRDLSHLARRYDLTPQTIADVHELTRSIHEKVGALKKTNPASEEREAALENIRQQTERAMIAKLGARAAETYRRNFNNWDEIPDP